MAFDDATGQCMGTALTKSWNDWAETQSLLPQSFVGQNSWDIGAGFSQNLLQSGAWRMAYKNELLGIGANCGDSPKVNRTVFSGTPSFYVWSGSPDFISIFAWYVDFGYGFAYSFNRSDFRHVRLVRAGQSFADLSSPASQDTSAGAQTTFPAITLDASASPGQAWGGARISGGGSPEFQVNGTGDWVTEAIVKSGDTLTVRLTAPAAAGSSNTATLTLHSGETTGTSANGANGGDESTEMKEQTASFTVKAINYAITTAVSPAGAGTLTCTPNPVLPGDDSSCSASANPNYTFSAFSGDCTGSTCNLTNVTSAKNVTAGFTQNISGLTLPEGPQSSQPLGVSLTPGNGWHIDSATPQTLGSVGTSLPAGLAGLHGLVNLQLSGGTAGTAATVVLTYPQPLPPGTQYYKYGPTAADPTDHWYPFAAAVISGNTITLTLTDGDDGDDDPTPSSIKDPGGPVVPMGGPVGATSIPTLSEWALVLLSALMALAALGWVRGRG